MQKNIIHQQELKKILDIHTTFAKPAKLEKTH